MRSVMTEQWPWLLLEVVFVVGTATAGLGVGLVSAMLVFPVSGAVYLIRATARRRKQQVSSTAATARAPSVVLGCARWRPSREP